MRVTAITARRVVQRKQYEPQDITMTAELAEEDDPILCGLLLARDVDRVLGLPDDPRAEIEIARLQGDQPVILARREPQRGTRLA